MRDRSFDLLFITLEWKEHFRTNCVCDVLIVFSVIVKLSKTTISILCNRLYVKEGGHSVICDKINDIYQTLGAYNFGLLYDFGSNISVCQ